MLLGAKYFFQFIYIYIYIYLYIYSVLHIPRKGIARFSGIMINQFANHRTVEKIILDFARTSTER
jgi:hypothetical protein